jgi:LSD1 subclass zinc finger protein
VSPAGRTVFVKRTRCHACGAPKLKPPRTGYVYCDFCGALIDWDFRVAVETPGSKLPGPQYEVLVRSLKPELDTALAARDYVRYATAQERIYDLYVKLCPAAVPVRCGDPAYRTAWVRFTAASATAQEFDPTYAQHKAAMEASVGRLAWSMGPRGKMQVRPDTFFTMFGIVRAYLERGMQVVVERGIIQSHPDRATPDLCLRMGYSTLVQGWLPMLAPAEGERLLAETKLKGDYAEMPEPALLPSRCSGCGADRPVPIGARRAVCEACGKMDAIGAIQASCFQCGAPVTFPPGEQMVKCGSCNAELRAMRW